MWAIILLIWSRRGSRALPGTHWDRGPSPAPGPYTAQGSLTPSGCSLGGDVDFNTVQTQSHRPDPCPGRPAVPVRSPELSPLQRGCDDAPHKGVLRLTGASCRNRVILQDVLCHEMGCMHHFTRYIQKSEISVASLGCRDFGRETVLFFGVYLLGQ